MSLLSNNIYIFIAITLDESIFLDVLHFPMNNIKSHDLEVTPMGGTKSKPASDIVCYSCIAMTLSATIDILAVPKLCQVEFNVKYM